MSPGWEKNTLWFIGSSINQSQLSWAVLSAGGATVPLQNSLGKELVLVERVRTKVVLVVQQKTQIGQIV